MPHKIPFETCLAKLIAPEDITAFSSAVSKEVPMRKVTRLATFPDYLFIQVRRPPARQLGWATRSTVQLQVGARATRKAVGPLGGLEGVGFWGVF